MSDYKLWAAIAGIFAAAAGIGLIWGLVAICRNFDVREGEWPDERHEDVY